MEEGPEDAYEDKNFRDDEGDYSVTDGSLDMGCVVSKGKSFSNNVSPSDGYEQSGNS